MVTATTAKPKEAADITDTRRQYELLLIISPAEGDQDRIRTFQEWQKTIQKEGGEVVHEETIGMRELAYSIRKHERGYYVLCHFLLDPSKQKGIKKKLIVDTRLLRFLLMEIPIQSKIEIFDKDIVYGGAKTDDSAVAQELARQRKQGRSKVAKTEEAAPAKPAVKVVLPAAVKTAAKAAVVPPIELKETATKGDELIKEEHEGAPSEAKRMADLDEKLKELLG